MSFALTLALLCGSGLALARALRVATGRLAVDLPLAWFLGSGWYGLSLLLLRTVAGVPGGRAAALAVVAAPVALWGALRARGQPPPAEVRTAARWRPRPLRAYLPMAAYVVLVTAAVVVHGANTPTHTDDGFRVRALAPLLAFDDGWNAAARGVLAMAGAVPTFVPSLAWRLTGAVDAFHVNYAVLADFLALLALAVGLASTRGAPERGWAGVFGLLSLPLLVYHATSTYADAVLAAALAAAFLFQLEHARTRDPADAARAVLLLAVAAMVKREGALLAATCLAALLLQAWPRGPEGRGQRLRLACLAALVPLALVATWLAARSGPALPLLDLLVARLSGAPGPTSGAAQAAASAAGAPGLLAAYRYALWESGNAGMIFWVLPPVVLLTLPRLRAARLGWPVLTVGLLLAEATASALWLVPAFTLDGSTVHRSLLAVSALATLLVAEVLAGPGEA